MGNNVVLPKILCVDDEPAILDAFRRQLRGKYDLEISTDPIEALVRIKGGHKYAVIVSDMKMPGTDGARLLKSVAEVNPQMVRVMLTGNLDQATTAQAINDGHVFRFLTKPCSVDDLEKVLVASVEQHRLLTAEKDLVQNTLAGTIKVLGEILSLTDPIAVGSGSILREPVRSLGKALGLRNVWELEIAAILAPIGWITINEGLKRDYRSAANGTTEDDKLLTKVCETSSALVAAIPRLEGVARIIKHSSINYDGSNTTVPELRGQSLAEGGRLLKVVRDLVPLEAAGVSRIEALKKLASTKGRYDPALLEILLSEGQEREAPAKATIYSIQPKELMVGHRLMANLCKSDGKLLLGAGTYISELLLKSIRNYADSETLKLPIMVDSRIPTSGGN